MSLPIRAEFTSSGALALLEAGQLSLLQYPATELEAGASQIFLRVLETGEMFPLTGPACDSQISFLAGFPTIRGEHGGIEHVLWWDQSSHTFAWRWQVRNLSTSPLSVDLAFGLDAGLAPREEIERNEYYISQYLDVTPFPTAIGTALGVRQNMPASTNPWLGLVSTPAAAGWASDARQVLGTDKHLGIWPEREFPSTRLQHEHTYAALRTGRLVLAPGETTNGAFMGWAVADHPAPTGEADANPLLDAIDQVSWVNQQPATTPGEPVVPTILAPATHLVCDDLDPERLSIWCGELEDEEFSSAGLLSAFTKTGHLVTRAKELNVLRPHGQVLHAATSARADSSGTTATVWAAGGFLTQLTLGHACANPVLSRRRSYLGLRQGGGLRIAARVDDHPWQLLGLPSAWLLAETSARWLYVAGAVEIEVEVRIHPMGRIELEISATGAQLAACFDTTDQLKVTGLELGDDTMMFADTKPHGTTWRCVELTNGILELNIGSQQSQPTHDWRIPSLTGEHPALKALGRTLGWFTHDAQVHYQSPRGLEQFTGGAWGTRDVCQGPVGLLVAAGEYETLRELLCQIFAAQYLDGDWPQWFEYLPERIAADQAQRRDSHGDIVYWPLLALGEYLEATGDARILDQPANWAGSDRAAATIREHVLAALTRIGAYRTSDGALPTYGHGDWNDALQPASSDLATRLMSVWTAVLEAQTLSTLARGLAQADPIWSAELAAEASRVSTALLEVALVDDELAGYVHFGKEETELLVHPKDQLTGLHHGALQLIHAISAEVLSPEQARDQLAIIDRWLSGPTGIYLFDRPVEYRGGPIQVFKRAEAATFWGREIGLMYTHAHLRYVEALCQIGDATKAWDELLKVIPIGLSQREPMAALRQLTCYYSSSDAAFPDRWSAQDQPDALFDGSVPFEGGWRVYSSGPGIALRLVGERLIGVRVRGELIELDPMIPAEFGEVRATVQLAEGPLSVVITPDRSVPTFAGRGLSAKEHHNRYRRAGWVINRAELADLLATNPSGILHLGGRIG